MPSDLCEWRMGHLLELVSESKEACGDLGHWELVLPAFFRGGGDWEGEVGWSSVPGMHRPWGRGPWALVNIPVNKLEFPMQISQQRKECSSSCVAQSYGAQWSPPVFSLHAL